MLVQTKHLLLNDRVRAWARRGLCLAAIVAVVPEHVEPSVLELRDDGLATLVARLGLLAWMNPVSAAHHGDDRPSRIVGLAGDLERLPAETRSTLHILLADPAAVTRARY